MDTMDDMGIRNQSLFTWDLRLATMPGKKFQTNIRTQKVVKNGDEDHGIEAVKKKHIQVLQGEPRIQLITYKKNVYFMTPTKVGCS